MKGRKKPKAAAVAAEAELADPAPKRRKKASKVVGGSYAVDSYLARLMSLKSRSRSADSDIAFVLAADEDAGLQPVKERVSTGLLELDKFIGGGYPVGRIVELAAWENIGKALSLDTPVLTPAGFVPMRDVKEGSSVLGQNGLPTKVLGVYPQGLQPIYRLTFSDGAQTHSTADHLWTVRNYYDGTVSTRPLRELQHTKVSIPIMQSAASSTNELKWTDSLFPSRVLTSIEPAGEAECQCIRVEAADGLFVIEDFIVTHNSTLIDQSIAMAQQSGAIVALIDSEKARDREYTRRLGVNLDELIIASIDTLEQGFEAADSMLAVQEAIMLEGEARARPFMLFWDSLGGTPTKAELEGAADDRHVATQAIMIKQNFRRLCMRLNELRGCLVFANQFYEKIGGMGGLATSGGSGVRYFTSLRLWMTKGNYLKSGTTDVGQIVNVKMRKTRLGSPKPPIELGLIFGSGFDNAWTLFEWGKVNGVGEKHRWIEQRGSWCYLTMPDTGEVQQWQGTYLGFSALLREQPKLYELLATLFLQESEQS